MLSQRAAEVSSCKLVPRFVTSKLLLATIVGLLAFALGCGSSGSNIPITGSFSNSSLKGNYTYHLFGEDTNGQYAEGGVFVADGNGNITSGTDDFNQFGSGFASSPITGKYSIGRDGNGQITFTINGQSGNTFTVAVTLVSTSSLYMTEIDSFANAYGEATLQDTTAFAAAPNGTFAFRIHDSASTFGNTASLVGALTSNAGTVTGSLDEVRGGTLHAGAALTSGSFQSLDAATGRGTLSFIDSLAIPSNYVFYVIDANTVEVLQTDPNNLGLGRLERQSGGAIALSGNYVFGSKGDTTSNGSDATQTVGGFTSDGTSAITGGAYDSVQDGNQIVDQPFTGSFTSGGNGRFAVTLNPQGGSPITEVFWMVSSTRGFFLVSDPVKVEDGTIDAQQSGSFSVSSLKGQYAFLNGGFDFTPQLLTRVGTFIPDGNGNLNLNEIVNAFPLPPTGSILNNPVVPGTYAVDATGRATATLTGTTSNIDLVFYMVSPGQAYVLQNDAGVEISGKTTLQVSP